MHRPRPRVARRPFALAALIAALLVPASAPAEPWTAGRWTAATYDALIVRPVAVAAAAAGAGFFAIAYPFTLLFGDPDAVRASFLEEPFRFAVRRPLGKFGS